MRELDLLSGSALLLSRASYLLLQGRARPPGWLVPAVRELVRAVEALADDPESPEAGRRAADTASQVEREAARAEEHRLRDPRVALVAEAVLLVASDVARVAAPDEARSGPDA